MNLQDYTDWSAAYRHFNDRLLAGRLPEVVFTLHRRANSPGLPSERLGKSRGRARSKC